MSVARVAGVDGCRRGWCVVTSSTDGTVDVAVEPSIAELLARDDLDAIAIDMPIGLPDDGRRACDVHARALLGARRSSVFPTPCRATLGAGTYVDACARSERATGRRLSMQAFNLLPRIAELDAALVPARQVTVVEAHPELAFARLSGTPMAEPKRTARGRAARAAALRPAGIRLPVLPPRGAAMDDVLDAAVLTLVARAVADGTAERLGDGTRDARGLRLEIVTLRADRGSR